MRSRVRPARGEASVHQVRSAGGGRVGNIYGHVIPAMQEEAAGKIDAALQDDEPPAIADL